MDWLDWLAVAILAGAACLAAMYISHLLDKIESLRQELDWEREVSTNLGRAAREIAQDRINESMQRRRVEWELSQAKEAVNRIGWAEKWN